MNLDLLQDIDAQLLLYLNSMHCAFFDELMWGLTSAKVWIPMYIVLAWVLQRRYGWSRAMLWAVVLIICCFGLSELLCGHLIRNWIARPRPSNEESPIWQLIHTVHDYRGGHYGFPSCHAANSVGLATIASLILRRKAMTITLFTWSVIHTYSRIYLGVHYPGDIIVGAITGGLGSYLIYRSGVAMGKIKETAPQPTDWALPAWLSLTLVCILIYATVMTLW